MNQDRTKQNGKSIDLLKKIITLATAIVVFFVAYRSCTEEKPNGHPESNDPVAKCVEGPSYASNIVALRVEPVLKDCWFVAVSQNAPDAVWVQHLSRQDLQGNLRLEAYGFSGTYAVYIICDEPTKRVFIELQKRAANNQPATLNDIPESAIKLCEGQAN